VKDSGPPAAPMLSSGVECLLDSSACTGTEDLHKGLPLSIPAGLMAVSEPGAGLDAKPDVSTPELACSNELSSEHHRTLEAKGFGEGAAHLDDMVREVHWEPAELLTEELLHDGDVENNEENKQTWRKQDCSSGEYQQGGKEAKDAEEDHAECCVLNPGGKWLKQVSKLGKKTYLCGIWNLTLPQGTGFCLCDFLLICDFYRVCHY